LWNPPPAIVLTIDIGDMLVSKMTREVYGERSERITSDSVEAFVTHQGAHMAPVSFSIGDSKIQPYSVAPWAIVDSPAASDIANLPPLLRVLRGDFFCMPFGSSETPYNGIDDPGHGEPANAKWTVLRNTSDSVELMLDLNLRSGSVTRKIHVNDGESAVYQQQIIKGLEGPMSFGMHAMIKFNSPGFLSTSPIRFGQVCPTPFELPEKGGYCALAQGARFTTLEAVPMINGEMTDLTVYPSRDGFEDLVMVSAAGDPEFAWSAVTFPEEGFLWLQLKDPRSFLAQFSGSRTAAGTILRGVAATGP